MIRCHFITWTLRGSWIKSVVTLFQLIPESSGVILGEIGLSSKSRTKLIRIDCLLGYEENFHHHFTDTFLSSGLDIKLWERAIFIAICVFPFFRK